VGVEISAEIKTEIKIKRGIINFSKIIFFLFERCNISVNIIKDSTIIISSASETLTLKVDSIYYYFSFVVFGCA